MTIAKKDLFDFDTLLKRRGTASLKWEKYKARDIIPLWVADMDFRSPPAVIEALHQLVDIPLQGPEVKKGDGSHPFSALRNVAKEMTHQRIGQTQSAKNIDEEYGQR